MTQPKSEKKNIVVIGAGYGGVTAALRLARLFRSSREFSVHLVDKNPFHTLKTQLHEAAVHKRGVTIDIGRIIRNQNITFHLGSTTAINLREKTILIGDQPLTFEFLIVALGSQTNFHNIAGLEQYALTLQSASDAEAIYQRISVMCAKASSESDPVLRKEMLRFVVGGGGLSGIELAAELVDHIAQSVKDYHLSASEPEVIVVEAAGDILPASGKELREQVTKRLIEKGVRLLPGTRVVEVSSAGVTLSTGEILRSGTVIWTGGIRIADVAKESGFSIGQSGRILVNEYLQSATQPSVYAIGDNALAINPGTGNPVPAAAQFALQQGRLVADNIHSVVLGKPQRKYVPKVWGEVVSLGRHLAVAWLALPILRKLAFVGFIASLLKAAIAEKHIILLKKESRNWISY
jgi:NADH:ubiquinone reductase (H+-translocating)